MWINYEASNLPVWPIQEHAIQNHKLREVFLYISSMFARMNTSSLYFVIGKVSICCVDIFELEIEKEKLIFLHDQQISQHSLISYK